jgi:hypothetical protein
MKVDNSPSVERAKELLRDPERYFAQARRNARTAVLRESRSRSRASSSTETAKTGEDVTD